MKKLSSKAIIITGISILGLIILLTVLFFTIRITVPDVTGKSLDEGTKMLNKNTFRIETEEEYHDTVPENIVFWQQNASGEKLKMGSVITIKVSKGIEPIEVPNVEKVTVDEANAALVNSKFAVKVTEVFDDDHEKGTVISQNTAAGEMLPKGSEIEIVVSKGPDLVQVPDITGMSLDAAQKAITAAGLSFQTDIQCSDSVEEGYIISQDVESGSMIKRHSPVFAYVSASVANTVGNTPSNSSQWGRVAVQGNWVYYTNSNYNYYLYKMRTDGSEKQILSKCVALGINVVGEWVYYTSDDSNGDRGLYKIRIDGNQKTKISDDVNYFVHVANDWIYTAKYLSGRNIYRMKTDGTEKALICSDSCSNINILGDWIYYTETNSGAAYKIRTDGSEKTKLHNDFTAMDMVADGNTVVATEMYEFLKINTDGSGFLSYNGDRKQKSYINANNGWVYFIEHNFTSNGTATSAFYKMRYDTSEKTKILDLTFRNSANYFINVADGWLYFSNEDDNGYLYRVKTDGTQLEKMYQ